MIFSDATDIAHHKSGVVTCDKIRPTTIILLIEHDSSFARKS